MKTFLFHVGIWCIPKQLCMVDELFGCILASKHVGLVAIYFGCILASFYLGLMAIYFGSILVI
jgi:hypothetical protein